jgi:hypothetical protein
MSHTYKNEHKSDSAHTNPRMERKSRPAGRVQRLFEADLYLEPYDARESAFKWIGKARTTLSRTTVRKVSFP